MGLVQYDCLVNLKTIPGLATPPDRVQALRTAFAETLRDPEFLADARQANLDVDPIPGDEPGPIVEELLRVDRAVATKLKGILR